MKPRFVSLAWLLAAMLPSPAAAQSGSALRSTPEPVRAAIAPGKAEEVCMKLERGDTLYWRFSADVPLGFNLHQHLDGKVDMPVNLRAMRSDNGRFVATHGNDWCLMWTAPKNRAAALEGEWSKTVAAPK